MSAIHALQVQQCQGPLFTFNSIGELTDRIPGRRRTSKMSLTFPIDAKPKNALPVQLVLADERDVEGEES